jgi:hypothetical protein
VRATIYKNNFFSKVINEIHSADYLIHRTPYELSDLGYIEGKAIKFLSDRIITITYQGTYHLYEYDDLGAGELVSDSLPSPVKSVKLFGDTLWYTTHNDGIYVYSLTDPSNPQRLFHLQIDGYLQPFARKDTLVALGDLYQLGPIRIFAYSPEGEIRALGSIGDFFVDEMAFFSNFLVTVRNYSILPYVFDASDPANINLVYSGYFGNYNRGFIHGDSVVMMAGNGDGFMNQYLMLGLAAPASPQVAYAFVAPGQIENIIQDSLAVGKYYFDWNAMTVFRRGDQNDFEALAMISERAYEGHGGSFPPYFIIGSHLYKLTPRQIL